MYNVTKEWRNLHEEELRNVFSSLYIMIYWRKKKLEISRTCNFHGTNFVVENFVLEDRCVQNNNIKMVIKDIWWNGVDWINLAQNSGQWLMICR
jgi:hypothetical protein